ncbi:MAG: hypothetical protein ACHQDC_08700 [Acidimicrobiales bacterium]
MSPAEPASPEPASPEPGAVDPNDPVLVRRAAVVRWCNLGQRVGYSCFGAAVVLFVVGFIVQFPAWLVTVILTLMFVGSVALLPAIIFGYAAKAAEKEERGEKFGY